MTRKQIVVGDGKSGRPYPEDLHPNAKITKRGLLAAIRNLQERVRKLETSNGEDR